MAINRRAFMRRHDDHVDDLKLAFAEVQRVYPGKPVFLQGESLGAGTEAAEGAF